MALLRPTAGALVLALGFAGCGGSGKGDDKAKSTQTTTPPPQAVTTPPTPTVPPATPSGGDSQGTGGTPPSPGGSPSPAKPKGGGQTGGVYPNRPPAQSGADPNQSFQQYCKQNPRNCGD